ncbi:MAG: dihydropteroate synthase [Chloroflexota bacterium]|nr:dihydropteroate synthase [Chloroflexota bacterium]
MGVLNATPDSFSGDGVAADPETLERRVRELVDEAPDVIDIGGESTRPGAAPVDAETELARVLPAIEAVRSHDLDLPISIDTRKAVVAERAIVAGADAINDVSGLRDDPGMAELAAGTGVPVVVMHSRRARAVHTDLGGQYRGVRYDDVVGDVMREGLKLVDVALEAGIAQQALIFDPGIGFGKTPAQNVELLRKLETLREIGLPLLVGVSRKSFIGELTGQAPAERLEGSLAAAVAAVAKGADMVRVHDVAATRRAVAVADALYR